MHGYNTKHIRLLYELHKITKPSRGLTQNIGATIERNTKFILKKKNCIRKSTITIKYVENV